MGAMRRRGISLMEVLFAIGIVGVGLLGIVTLVPLAMRQIGQGNDYDRTSRMGQNALADFEIRSMGNVENWRFYNAVTSTFDPVPGIAPQNSVAIDPLALSLTANQTVNGTRFPSNGLLWMDRYTLRSAPDSLAPPAVLPPTVPRAMSSLHADRLFILRDELIFSIPGEVNQPPAQVFNWEVGADNQWGAAGVDDDQNGTVDDATEAGFKGSDDQVTTRQTDGVYSWLATLTPKLDSRNYPENIARDYVLSVVVFRNRDFSVTNNISERTVEVAQIYGDGTGGGDMLLRTLSGSPSPAEDLNGVRVGNWIMLGCALPVYASAAATVNYFGWYRVDSLDDEPVLNAGQYELNVALSGPNWPLSLAVKPASLPNTGTQAVILKNVIAVYQKVLHLETSSLWTN